MPLSLANQPLGPLYRIGRGPDPLAWPPFAFSGTGRYDDPDNRFTVLYAAEQRRDAFVETLAPFRPAVNDIAIATSLTGADPTDQMPVAGIIPDTYFDRRIAYFRVAPRQRWLDLRTPETHQVLRSELAATLVRLGYGQRFVWGDVLGHDHRLTQAIAAYAFDRGYHGTVYTSCHDATLDCWALFNRAVIERIDAPSPIDKHDPDLVAVARLFDLTIP